LEKGGTVIAEKTIKNGDRLYDVRLNIHWPEEQP